MDDLELLTSAEVAEILRLNPQIVQRKLQSGEIPGYRIGREWRVSHIALREWLEARSNQNARRGSVAGAFFDKSGRLKALPASRPKRREALMLIAETVPADRVYKERELNTLLRNLHSDVATIRRELVAEGLLIRTKDGVYKRTGPRESA